jgi:hypothetical protein
MMQKNGRHSIKKRLSWFGPGVPFSTLTKLSLPQPKRADSSTTTLQRVDDFVEF